MSNIEYDNANFKDKLTSLLAERSLNASRVVKPESGLKLKKEEEGNGQDGGHILDVLGQLGSGKHFFDN